MTAQSNSQDSAALQPPPALWPGVAVERYAGPVGAELRGIDAAVPLTQPQVAGMARLLAERGVIVLRGQHLTPLQQIAFSAQFGELETFADQSESGNPQREIFRVSNRGDGYDVGHYWHSDGSTRPKPTAISTLLAVEVELAPEASGTRFLSAVAAYAELAPTLRQALAPLHWNLATRAAAPLVRRHPVSGAPLLWLPLRFPAVAGGDAELTAALAALNRDIRPRVDGMHEADSQRLLFQLVRHLTGTPEWEYTHAWQPGDLLLWDQRSVYHHAGASPRRRVLHRTAVRGTPALAYASQSPQE